jgi:hypothetical protein
MLHRFHFNQNAILDRDVKFQGLFPRAPFVGDSDKLLVDSTVLTKVQFPHHTPLVD